MIKQELFHTINLKAAVALATMGFKMHTQPVSRLVRSDGRESVEFWFECTNDKGQSAEEIYRGMTKEADILNENDPENPLNYIRSALANRDVLVDIIRQTPRYVEIVHSGKRIAIREDATENDKKEMSKLLA